MPSITDPLPPNVAADLARLRAGLNATVPPKHLDDNLLIATWNLRAFGGLNDAWDAPPKASPSRDLRAVACIAEILSRFDVIAVQEATALPSARRGSHRGQAVRDHAPIRRRTVEVDRHTDGQGSSSLLDAQEFEIDPVAVPTASHDHHRPPDTVLLSLSPGSVGQGSADFTLSLFGQQFVSTSVARWNGADLATQFVSEGELHTTVPAALVAAAGQASVTVFNPAPGGGESNGVTFTVANPIPSVSGLSPTQVMVGSGALTLTVTGTNFTSNSINQGGITPAANTLNAPKRWLGGVPRPSAKRSQSNQSSRRAEAIRPGDRERTTRRS